MCWCGERAKPADRARSALGHGRGVCVVEGVEHWMLRRIRAFVNGGGWHQTYCGSSGEDLVGIKHLVGSHWHFGRVNTKHAGEIEHTAPGNARQQAVSGPRRDEAP